MTTELAHRPPIDEIQPIDEVGTDTTPEQIFKTVKEMDDNPSFLSTPLFESGKLNTDVKELSGMWGFDSVVVAGNSGLFFVEAGGIYYQHFLPDSSSFAKPGKERKFAEVYATALTDMAEWARAQDEEINIYGVTNPTNSKYRQKLMGESYKVLENRDDGYGEEVIYEINLSELAGDDSKMARLERLKIRALKQDYEMSSW